jgi:hypothetical protein
MQSSQRRQSKHSHSCCDRTNSDRTNSVHPTAQYKFTIAVPPRLATVMHRPPQQQPHLGHNQNFPTGFPQRRALLQSSNQNTAQFSRVEEKRRLWLQMKLGISARWAA